jgi:mannose/fructose-specific phosphotransferase system component IIA
MSSEAREGAAPLLRAVLLGHGTMPDGLVDAVRHITGCEADVITPVTNRGKSPETLAAEVSAALQDGAGVVFTDLQSGSCGFVARRLLHSAPGLVVVSGVNLPVLVEFAMNRHLPVAELVPRLLAKGRAAIGCAPAELEDHERRAASH